MSVPGSGPPKQNPQVPPRNDGNPAGAAGRGATSGSATLKTATPKNAKRPPPADEQGRGSAGASHTPKEEGRPSLADYERLSEVVKRLTTENTNALTGRF